MVNYKKKSLNLFNHNQNNIFEIYLQVIFKILQKLFSLKILYKKKFSNIIFHTKKFSYKNSFIQNIRYK